MPLTEGEAAQFTIAAKLNGLEWKVTDYWPTFEEWAGRFLDDVHLARVDGKSVREQLEVARRKYT